MLGGGFKYFLYVHLYLGEMIHLDEHIFQMRWLNHQLKDNMNVHKHPCGGVTDPIFLGASLFSCGPANKFSTCCEPN